VPCTAGRLNPVGTAHVEHFVASLKRALESDHFVRQMTDPRYIRLAPTTAHTIRNAMIDARVVPRRVTDNGLKLPDPVCGGECCRYDFDQTPNQECNQTFDHS
jgi:hypothetical protein